MLFKKLLLMCALFGATALWCMDNDQVTIQTSDGKDFKVRVSLAKKSLTIKNLIEDAGIDNPIPLPTVNSKIWIKIQELLPFIQEMNGLSQTYIDRQRKKEIKTRIITTVKTFDGPTLLAFIAAVNYLDIPALLKAGIAVAKNIDVKKIKAEEIAALPREIRNPIIFAQSQRILGSLPFKELAVIKDHKEMVFAVCVTPDGSKIISGSNNTVRVWDLAKYKELAVLKGHTEWITSACVTSDGSRAISGSRDGTIRIWDLSSYKEIAVLKGHGVVTSVCVTPDGSKVIAGSYAGGIHIWDLSSYEDKEIVVISAHQGRVGSVCVTYDGKKIISGSESGTIRVWDLHNHKELAVLKGHEGEVSSVCVTLDSGKIISGSTDGTIRIWNLNTYKEMAVLKDHKSGITSICVTLDGSKIISGSGDKTIRIWDLASHQQLAVLQGHTDMVTSVCATFDSNKIISGSVDKTIRIWDISLFKLLPVLQAMSLEQATQIWKYVQGRHKAGWAGIKRILKK